MPLEKSGGICVYKTICMLGVRFLSGVATKLSVQPIPYFYFSTEIIKAQKEGIKNDKRKRTYN